MESEELAHHTEGRKNQTVLILPDPHRIVDKTIRHQLGSGAERPGKYRGANGRTEPYVGLTTRKKENPELALGVAVVASVLGVVGRRAVGDGCCPTEPLR